MVRSLHWWRQRPVFRESKSQPALEALYGAPDHRDGGSFGKTYYWDVHDPEKRLALERIDMLRQRVVVGATQLGADLGELWRSKVPDVRALNDSLEDIARKHRLTHRYDWPQRDDEWDNRNEWVYDEQTDQEVYVPREVWHEHTCQNCFRIVKRTNKKGLCDGCRRAGGGNPLCRICGQKPMKGRIYGRCDDCQKYYERNDGRERSEFLTPKDTEAEAIAFIKERYGVAKTSRRTPTHTNVKDRTERDSEELPVDPRDSDSQDFTPPWDT
jgi:hypothetical protein